MRRARAAGALLVAAALLPGCETTRDKSKRQRAGGSDAFDVKGVEVTRDSPYVRVGTTRVLTDRNGTAVVVELINRSGRDLAGVPVSIDVFGAGRRMVFENDQPGLEPALTSASLLRGGESMLWVNDQVQTGAPARGVRARAGVTTRPVPASPPRLQVSSPRFGAFASSGVFVSGTVANPSSVDQHQLTLFAVARRGGRVVAAGRGAIERLPARSRRPYRIFFIGNPKGALVEIAAPPTVLS